MEVLLAALGAAVLAVALATVVLYVAYRRVIRRHLLDELARLSGTSAVQALPPQQVMTTLLSTVYGDSDASRAFIAGLLGGEGRDPRGTDLTISTDTSVATELQAVDDDTCEVTSTVTYSFKDSSPDHRFVIFATCDPLLRDSITLGSRFPLFESWFVPEQSLFEDSIDAMLPSVWIGISYTVLDRGRFEVEPTNIKLTEVLYHDWPEYLRLFREPWGVLSRLDPARYMRTLRIFEYDLDELAHADHVVSSVEWLSLRSTTLQPVDQGFCYWQPPYPCYVERMSFDAAGLAAAGHGAWLFQVVPFTFQTELVTSGWVPADQLGDYAVRSWLLPGHGVALLWKPSVDDDLSPGDRPGI